MKILKNLIFVILLFVFQAPSCHSIDKENGHISRTGLAQLPGLESEFFTNKKPKLEETCCIPCLCTQCIPVTGSTEGCDCITCCGVLAATNCYGGGGDKVLFSGHSLRLYRMHNV